MQLRRGREFYGKKVDEALSLYNQGKSINEIAKDLGISYSTAYHWVKGIRKPEAGNVNDFMEFLRSNGPSAALHIMKKFPKHNELFLMSSRRGLSVKRAYLGKKYRELATWYYIEGQEKELEMRVGEIQKKIDEARDKFKRAADK
jgi:predicted transcriptional regulator